MMIFGGHAAALYNAESAKTKLWKAASAAAGVALLGAFLSVPQQAYADAAPHVFAPAVAGKTPRKFTQIQAAPQLADLSLQPFFDVPQAAGPGKLGKWTGTSPQSVDLTLSAFFDAPQLNPSGWLFTVVGAGPDASEYPTLQAMFTRSAVQGLVSGKLGTYCRTLPQPDLTQQPFFDAPQVSGALPRIVPSIWTLEQTYTNPAPLVTRASSPLGGAKLGAVVLAPQQAYSDVQPRIALAAVVGNLPRVSAFFNAAQVDTTQLDPQLFSAAKAAPAISIGAYVQASAQLDFALQPSFRRPLVAQGPVPPLVRALPQHFDYTLQGSFASAVVAVLGPPIQKGELVPLPRDDRRIVITFDDRRIYPVPSR